MPATTKPGKHGTLHLYAVEYAGGDGCPVFRDLRWAYDADHLGERIAEEYTAEGWEVQRYAHVTEAPDHRWTWHKYATA